MGDFIFNIEDVFKRYYAALVCFADRYLADRNESESLVQDTFVCLWEMESVFDKEVALKTWLYTTVRNKALNVLKRDKIRAVYNRNLLGEIDAVEFYEESLIEEETRRLLMEAIDRLPVQCRKVCLLNLEGFDNAKIADRMSISIDTVKYHKKNAYRLLRAYMDAYLKLILLLFN